MRTTITIPGIHCHACEMLIRDVSGDFPAITDISVDIQSKKVTLDYGDGFNLADWSNAIAGLGPEYRVQSA